MTYRGKQIDIMACERGYYWIIWSRVGVPLSTPYSFHTAEQAMANAKRYCDRLYKEVSQWDVQLLP